MDEMRIYIDSVIYALDAFFCTFALHETDQGVIIFKPVHLKVQGNQVMIESLGVVGSFTVKAADLKVQVADRLIIVFFLVLADFFKEQGDHDFFKRGFFALFLIFLLQIIRGGHIGNGQIKKSDIILMFFQKVEALFRQPDGFSRFPSEIALFFQLFLKSARSLYAKLLFEIVGLGKGLFRPGILRHIVEKYRFCQHIFGFFVFFLFLVRIHISNLPAVYFLSVFVLSSLAMYSSSGVR